MKLKTLLLSLALVNTTIIGGFAITTKISFEKNNEIIQATIQDGKFYQELNDNSRQAQVNFQRQVQEWKNILIRGNDAELYKRYLEGFENREKLVQEGLTKVNKDLEQKLKTFKASDKKVEFTQVNETIEKLLVDHKELGVQYREALNTFNAEDPETGKKVDKLLRGIDRAASKGMDDVSEAITKITNNELTSLEGTVEQKNQENIQMLILASFILFGLVTTLLMLFRSYLMKVLGSEPDDLNEYFQSLSKGNFKSSIDVSDKYEGSIAYNSKLMHLKLKNMIKTIRNLTEEISSVKNVDINDSKESIVESLRNTKSEVRGLKETVDKFDF